MDSVYSPLKTSMHIRILTLSPSEDADAALEGSLDQHRINETGNEYEGISYTWGDQESSKSLICDGKMINITPNLASALLCLRCRKSPRRLWADAICINQDDLDEKAKQIPLMARIFRYASQVRVWLGKGEGGEGRAIDYLASFAKRRGPASFSTEMWQIGELLNLSRSAKKVFGLPWFGRRWIVQELVLNGNVMFHCGQSHISWPDLRFAFHALPPGIWDDDLEVIIRRKIQKLGDLWRTWSFGSASAGDRGIYSLLSSFTDLQCKEGKDRIYAIAGLADDIELQSSRSPVSIIPDYEICDNEVFQDLAFKMIRSGRIFSTLAHAGASRTADEEEPLPSWIPNARHPGSWPLIATERKAEFKLVEVCEPSNGSLTLKVEAYGWEGDTSLFMPSFARSHFGKTPCDWRPVSVSEVFEPPKSWRTLDGQYGQNILRRISRWLMLHQIGFEDLQPSLETLAHMLWSLIRCQLLTEDGCESFDRLPSLEHFQKQLRDGNLDNIWQRYLINALSTSKIFIGQLLYGCLTGPQKVGRFFGFGPHDLKSLDAMLLTSGDSKSVTALFLRPEGSKYSVLGGGLAWAWPAQLPLEGLVPREIEVHLI